MELNEQTQANLNDAAYRIAQSFAEAAIEHQLPHVLMRPKLSQDGDMWCALYGDNLQEGVAGFGKSPGEAMSAFDIEWWKKLPSAN